MSALSQTSSTAAPAGPALRPVLMSVPQAQTAVSSERPSGSAEATMLFVGPDAATLYRQSAELGNAAFVDSILEAILIAGPATDHALIVAGISQEATQLERAITSLRLVCPKARLVLVCEPGDEPLARRALRWGADDYCILPLGPADLRRITAPAAAAGTPAVAADGAVALPVALQAAAMEDLLQSLPDLAERLVARLQDALPWPGKLRLFPPDTAPEAIPLASAAVARDQMNWGSLAIEDARLTPALLVQLKAVATWLAGWLALARRDAQLRALAITDELSGAYNRRYFDKFVAGLLEKARREHFRVSLLMFDIDDFKHYNDRHGHAAGDEIIRQLITLLRRCTRPHDLVARVGGDEFAVVFWDNEAPRQPNSEHPRDAMAACERFRRAIASHDWAAGCKIEGSVSISGGIATFPWDATSFAALLSRADEALLKAKAAGKNAIFLHQKP